MKKTIAFVLAVLTVLGVFAACNPTDVETPTTQEETTTKKEEKTTQKEETTTEKETFDDVNLYNGITLPEAWPPRNVSRLFNNKIEIPYLKEIANGGTHPEVVNINVGRQLFVDDFLIDTTTLTTTYHKAVDYGSNPILSPYLLYYPAGGYDATTSGGDAIKVNNASNLKHGAIYYNASKKVYQMWMGAKINGSTGLYLFTSKDGVTWDEEPRICNSDSHVVKGTLTSKTISLNSGYMTVVKNPNPTDTSEKYICLQRIANGTFDTVFGKDIEHNAQNFFIWKSYNGTNWTFVGEAGECGDATTIFYNPFRQKWVISLRTSISTLSRCRLYYECDNIVTGLKDCTNNQVFWQRADKYDLRESQTPYNFTVQMYSVCATAYESIMVGGFQMFTGPENGEAEKTGIPKTTNIALGFSRDGFYFDRPCREPIISSERADATSWKRGYLHQISNLFVVHDDELWFYYSGYMGDESRAGDGVGNSGTLDKMSIGIAVMRRDGFASLDGTGTVTTRKMTCTKGQQYLFVNAKCESLKAEILDANGQVIPGYSMDDCIAFSGDSCKTQIKWTNHESIDGLSGTTFQIRFSQTNGEFYSFWVSATTEGESNGQYGSSVVSAENLIK